MRSSGQHSLDEDNLYAFDKKAANSYNRVPTGVGYIPKTATRVQTGFRMQTGTSFVGNDGRPMTSVRGAGYSSRGRNTGSAGQSFDPFNQASNH